MIATPLSILKTGLVTSVGLSAPASCAAIRAKVTNPTETRFIDSNGEWIMAHQVELEKPWRGLTKLAKMAAMAIEEALAGVPTHEWADIPLFLCVAERERPGRLEGLDDQLLPKILGELGARFSVQSKIFSEGRIGAAVALAQGSSLLSAQKGHRVLVAASDSLLNWPTLSHYERQGRLLTARNSNGFMPGEGAGAILLGLRDTGTVCTGFGFAKESCTVDSEAPLRGDGLSSAIKVALAAARLEMHDMDFRITDLSGEQYYFKEAALALSRTLHRRKEEFDIWHSAECTGEQGAVSGTTILSVADAACRKGYTKGSHILAHLSNDAGQRAALTLEYRRKL